LYSSVLKSRSCDKEVVPSGNNGLLNLWGDPADKSVSFISGSNVAAGSLSIASAIQKRRNTAVLSMMSGMQAREKSVSMQHVLHHASRLLTSETESMLSTTHGADWTNTTSVRDIQKRHKKFNGNIMAAEVCHRPVEAWLVVILSIITPSLSILLYAKSLVWAATWGWDDDMISFLFFTHIFCFGFGSMMWIYLMQRIVLSKCLFGAGLLYLTNSAYFAPIVEYRAAVVLSAITGLASSSSGVLYMACVFFEEWESSLSLKIRRYGWVEGWRTAVSGLIQGTLIKFCLGNDSESLNRAMGIYVPVSAMTFVISITLLIATHSKMKTTKMPKIQLSTFLQLKSYLMLAASQVVESFISYQAVFVVGWLLLDGFSASSAGSWLQASAVCSGCLLFVGSRIVAPLPGTPKCFGVFATSLINPTLLMGILMMASPNMSTTSLLSCMAAIFLLIQIKTGLIGIWRIQVISSRWRAVTYYGFELFITSMVSAVSPFLMRFMAKAMSLSLDISGPSASAESAARAIVFTSLPFVAVSFGLQVLANKYFFADSCDVYTKSSSIYTARARISSFSFSSTLANLDKSIRSIRSIDEDVESGAASASS